MNWFFFVFSFLFFFCFFFFFFVFSLFQFILYAEIKVWIFICGWCFSILFFVIYFFHKNFSYSFFNWLKPTRTPNSRIALLFDNLLTIPIIDRLFLGRFSFINFFLIIIQSSIILVPDSSNSEKWKKKSIIKNVSIKNKKKLAFFFNSWVNEFKKAIDVRNSCQDIRSSLPFYFIWKKHKKN